MASSMKPAVPLSDGPNDFVDAALVRDQLDRILAHSLFTKSTRYPNFLRYVVERRLTGDFDHMKERILGVEVFGREAAYDCSVDPVVRNTASEVRKRLAQYYVAPQHDSELRIELPPGCYVPEFRFAP